MTSYLIGEGSFEIGLHKRPVDSSDHAKGPLSRLVDATVHVLDVEIGGVAALVVVERSESSGRSLDVIARQRAEREEASLPAYEPLASRDLVYGGAPATEVAARFRRADGEMTYLRRVHVGAERLVLCLSMSAPLAARDGCDAWMDAALASLRFRAE